MYNLKENIDFYNMPIEDIKKYAKLNHLTSKEFQSILKENKRFIPMSSDRLFRTLMNSKSSTNYLAHIINYTTGIDKSIIKKYLLNLDPYNGVDNFFDKMNTSDIKIRVLNNFILLEMNTKVNEMVFYKNRIGLAKVFGNLDDDRSYNSKRRTFLINFDYGFLFNISSNVIKSVSTFYDVENNIAISDDIIEIHLLLENLEKMYYTKSGKLREDINVHEIPLINKLLLMLSSSYLEDIEVIFEGLDEFMEFKDEVIKLADELKVVDGYYDGMPVEWWQSGYEYLGKKEGIKETQVSVIKNMLEEGVDIDTISKYLKLSVDEINKLLNEYDENKEED